MHTFHSVSAAARLAVFAVLMLAVALVTTAPAVAQSIPSGEVPSMLGFGATIAMADGEILVGSAPIDWPSGSDPAGEIYRYARQADGTWAEIGRIMASNGEHGDEFGRSILAADGRLYVGAPAMQTVYVFERTTGNGGAKGWEEVGAWTPQASLIPAGHEVGGAYARGGYRTQTLARVAPFTAVTTYNGDTNEGSVLVTEDGSSFRTLVDAPAWAIAASGNRLFIGAPTANGNRGEVLVYELHSDNQSGNHWMQTATLSGDGLDAGAMLGRALAADGDRVYAGAIKHGGSGAVVVFDLGSDGTWSQTHVLQQETGDDARPAGDFGHGLALSDTHLLVGARSGAFVVPVHHLDVAPTRLEAPADQRGRNFGVGLAVSGDALAVGAPSADYGSGRAIIYTLQADGSWVETSDALGDVVGLSSVTGGKVECEDGLAAGLYPCDQVDLLSMLSTADLVHDRGANLNDIWGWTDPETGAEYVLAARTDGVSFIDIRNPEMPVYVGQLMRTEGSPGAWWRDVKVYKDHAYIVADGSGDHGMQVFDLTQLRDVDPADMPVDFEPTTTYRGVASSHNIVINEETGFGYAVGSGSGAMGCGGQLHMIDLREPANPTFMGCYTHEEFGGTHDAQCVIYRGPDTDHHGKEICLNSNGNAFIIADVSDKDEPKTVAVARYPNTAYTHQGWLTDDHRYFYMNDELDEMNKIVDRTRTLVWDVSDLDEPILVNEYYHSNGASDHNLYVKGNLMYQSNYNAGLRILDISDPENPVEVGHFDTAPWAENMFGFAGSWSNYPFFKSGVIVVSSQAEGMFVLRKREVDL
jgi:choice-of-anchor B domain-containing protein